MLLNVYPLANYTFGTKEPKMEKDTSDADRLARMKANYMKEGMRTSVEAILLVIEENEPHILLLQTRNKSYELPGGRLKPGESEIEGLKRKLCSKLAVNSPSFPPNWQVGECVAMWWRLNFETEMYPCCPPHTTKPKECKKLFIVHLSEREYFAVPQNLKLLPVPLSELLNNSERYGRFISTIQHHLSKFHLNMVHSSKADHCIVAPNDGKSKGQGTGTVSEDDIEDAAHEEEECSQGLLKDGVLSRASKDGYTVNQEGGGYGQRPVLRPRNFRRGSLSPLRLLALERPQRYTWSEDYKQLLYEYSVEELESRNMENLSPDSYEAITKRLNDKGATCTSKIVKDKLNATKRLYSFYLRSCGQDDNWWDKNLKKRGGDYKNLRYKPPKHLKLIERIFSSENFKVHPSKTDHYIIAPMDEKNKGQGTGTISEDDIEDAAHEEEECSQGLLKDGVLSRASKDGYTVNQVLLQQKIKQESEQFRSWKAAHEKEVLQLKKEGRRNEYEMHKLLALNQRQKMVLQRKTEEAAAASKRLKELLEAKKSSRETYGAANGSGMQALMRAIDDELEVTLRAHELRSYYERQMQERAAISKEIAKLKEESKQEMSDCPQAMSPSARSSRISALENLLSSSSSAMVSMASQLSEAEERERVFNGKGRWLHVRSLPDAKTIMNHLFQLASSARCQVLDKEVFCNEKEHTISELKEKVVVLNSGIRQLETQVKDLKSQNMQLFTALNNAKKSATSTDTGFAPCKSVRSSQHFGCSKDNFIIVVDDMDISDSEHSDELE